MRRVSLLFVLLFLPLAIAACDEFVEVTPTVAPAAPPSDQSPGLGSEPTPSTENSGIVASIPLTIGSPSSVAVNPTTGSIYVAYSDIDVLSVFSADTFEAITKVDLPPGALHTVAVNPATNKVYVANAGNGTISVIDGATNEVIKLLETPTRPVNLGVASLFVNPATNRIYTSRSVNYGDWGMTVVDGERDEVIATIPLDGPARGMSADPSTNNLYVIIEYFAQILSLCGEQRILVLIDTTSNSLSECLDFGYAPVAVAASPDGSTLYHFSQTWEGNLNRGLTKLTIVEPSSKRALASIEFPEFTAREVAFNADTRRLYVLADDSGDCYIEAVPGLLLALDGDGTALAWRVPFDSCPIDFTADLQAGRFYVVTDNRTLYIIEE